MESGGVPVPRLLAVIDCADALTFRKLVIMFAACCRAKLSQIVVNCL